MSFLYDEAQLFEIHNMLQIRTDKLSCNNCYYWFIGPCWRFHRTQVILLSHLRFFINFLSHFRPCHSFALLRLPHNGGNEWNFCQLFKFQSFINKFQRFWLFHCRSDFSLSVTHFSVIKVWILISVWIWLSRESTLIYLNLFHSRAIVPPELKNLSLSLSSFIVCWD